MSKLKMSSLREARHAKGVEIQMQLLYLDTLASDEARRVLAFLSFPFLYDI